VSLLSTDQASPTDETIATALWFDQTKHQIVHRSPWRAAACRGFIGMGTLSLWRVSRDVAGAVRQQHRRLDADCRRGGGRAQGALAPEHVGEAIRAGGRYVAASPVLRVVLLRAALFVFFASSIWALLPLTAKDELHLGSGGYGLLLGCVGIGAVAGAAFLPSMRARLTPGALSVPLDRARGTAARRRLASSTLSDDEPPEGPVMVSVEYRPQPGLEDSFLAALSDSRWSRRRTGASSWRVWRDSADADRLSSNL
jgi:Transmembrane secretion effector